MGTQKLSAVDAFVVWDLDGAETSAGLVRLAPKILRDGAELLARSTTYSFAAYGLQMSGASAGINSDPTRDDRAAAVTAFMEEVAPLVAAGKLVLFPGTGITDADLGPLPVQPPDDADAIVAGAAVVAAGEAAGGGVGTAAIVGAGAAAEALQATLANTAEVFLADSELAAEVDALFLAGRAGIVDHEAAEQIRAKVVVPLTPLPITTKAYAVLSRNGVIYVPDFLVLAAPLLAMLDPGGGDPVERVRAAVSKAAANGVDAWRAAVADAEAFLASWRDALPFGRPLAT